MNAGERVVVADAAELARVAAERIARAFESAVSARGRFTIALAGGNTPKPVHEALCAPAYDHLPWTRIEVYFGDERCVAPDDPASNFRMARETLLVPRAIPDERVRRMRGEDPDRERAARDYEALLPPALDLIVMGMGDDGHTLSLFPGARVLDERVRRVAAVEGSKPPPWRLTLTPLAVAAARELLVIASGASKAAAVARALEGAVRPMETPVQIALRGTWVLDRDAASRLSTALR